MSQRRVCKEANIPVGVFAEDFAEDVQIVLARENLAPTEVRP